jgi:FAD/FMN-containing dehydrogenase
VREFPFVGHADVLSWGRVTREPQRVVRPRFRDELPDLIGNKGAASKLAVGLRRSYGDSCLNGSGALIDMRGVDRFIHFDRETGVLRAEAGVSLSDLLRLVVPKGWFAPTTPGTRFVTLGGALANDVHGKNHHGAGSFGRHVCSLGLVRSDRGRLTVTPESESALFSSTIGGLGLTGVIEWVELQLVRIGGAYLDVETMPYSGLDEFWRLARKAARPLSTPSPGSTARRAAKSRGVEFSLAPIGSPTAFTTFTMTAPGGAFRSRRLASL